MAGIADQRTIDHTLEDVGRFAEIQQGAGGAGHGHGVVGRGFAGPSRKDPALLGFDGSVAPSALEILGMTKRQRCKRRPIIGIALNRLFEENDGLRDRLSRPRPDQRHRAEI